MPTRWSSTHYFDRRWNIKDLALSIFWTVIFLWSAPAIWFLMKDTFESKMGLLPVALVFTFASVFAFAAFAWSNQDLWKYFFRVRLGKSEFAIRRFRETIFPLESPGYFAHIIDPNSIRRNYLVIAQDQNFLQHALLPYGEMTGKETIDQWVFQNLKPYGAAQTGTMTMEEFVNKIQENQKHHKANIQYW